MHHLIWFRSDLRLVDNPALLSACMGQAKANTRVSALYIDCVKQTPGAAPMQRDLISRNLQALSQELAALGIPLTLITLDTFSEVPARLKAWVAQQGFDAVFANSEPGIYEQRRDQAVAEQLAIPFNRFQADCVVPHGALRTGKGEMYRVFTPFARAWLKYIQRRGYAVLPAPQAVSAAIPAATIELSQPRSDSRAWPASEAAALDRLTDFCADQLFAYDEQRDFPATDGTSSLSPYLALGVLSPRQCLRAIEIATGGLPLSRGEAGFCWLNELIWREFYRHLMTAYPRLSMDRAFKADTEKLRWSQDAALFQAWCQGRTGYPLVDAAMRCLNHSGWMHNRLRMVVASFLTKDLHISWRQGEAYFMSKLIDGEFAANNGGWQWAAGTGADAAPYFRVFNPTSQSQRFDPRGRFIRQWLPELSEVPDKTIHAPWEWLTEQGRAQRYWPPIVDHAKARLQAIAMFESLKSPEVTP